MIMSRFRTKSTTTHNERVWRRHAKLLRKTLDGQNERLLKASRERDQLVHVLYVESFPEAAILKLRAKVTDVA